MKYNLIVRSSRKLDHPENKHAKNSLLKNKPPAYFRDFTVTILSIKYQPYLSVGEEKRFWK